jgi:CheY-like chemotaxis protein
LTTPEILLVEENRDDADLALLLLSKELPSIEVARVEDRDALEEALASARYDLVLTENRFSWGNGSHVLSLVRRRLPGCPVVMLTGNDSAETARDAMKEGFTDYLRKSARGYVMLGKRVQGILAGGCPVTGSGIISQYQRLLEIVDEAVFLATRDGLLLEVNPAFARLAKFSGSATVHGRRLADLFPNEPLSSFLEELDPNGEARGARIRFRDGSDVRITARLVTQAGRMPTLLVGKLQTVDAPRVSERTREEPAPDIEESPRSVTVKVNLETVLDEVLADLSSLVEQARTTVVRSKLPAIEGNHSDLARLFDNLLSTMLKPTIEEPAVLGISAHRMPTEWLFILKSSGGRIPETGFQEPGGEPRSGRVTRSEEGLERLNASRSLVDRQGGRLWVAPESDPGLTVYFTLPDRNYGHRESGGRRG